MADSLSKRIIAALATRLADITVANGFNTDAGSNVIQHRKRLIESDTFPLVCVYGREEEPERLTNGRYRVGLEVAVEAYAAEGNTPGQTTWDLVADIQKAIEEADDTLSGICHSIEFSGTGEMEVPDAGGDTLVIPVFYRVTYDRDYGDPYTPR